LANEQVSRFSMRGGRANLCDEHGTLFSLQAIAFACGTLDVRLLSARRHPGAIFAIDLSLRTGQARTRLAATP
jgi:hypothetical protein